MAGTVGGWRSFCFRGAGARGVEGGGRVGQREAAQEYERAWGLVEARVEALGLAGAGSGEGSLDEARFAFEEGYRAGYIKGLADHYPELEASMRAEKFYKDCVNELGQALAEAEQRNKALKLAAYENGFDAYSPGRASHPSTPQEIALHGDRDPLTPVIGSAQRSASASGRRSDTGVAALAMMRMSMGEPASSSSEPKPTRESAPPRVNRAPRGTPTAFSRQNSRELRDPRTSLTSPGIKSRAHYSDISSDSEEDKGPAGDRRVLHSAPRRSGRVGAQSSSKGHHGPMSAAKLMQMMDAGPSDDPDKHLADLQQAARELHVQDQMHSRRVDNVLKRMALAMDARSGGSASPQAYSSPRYARPRWGRQS